MDNKPVVTPHWIWSKEFEEVNTEFLILQDEVWSARKQIFGKFLKGPDTKWIEKLPPLLASGSFALPRVNTPTTYYLDSNFFRPTAEKSIQGLELTSIGLADATDIPDKQLYNPLFDETPTIGYLAALIDTLKPDSPLWPLDDRFRVQDKLIEEFRRSLLINLKERVTALRNIRDVLHSALARISEKQTDPPVNDFKAFIKNNKLPAPSDEDSKRNRLPITVAEELADVLDLTDKEMATILTISIRTYHRLKLNGLLNPVASERLVLLKDIAAYGLEVFEDQNTLNKWLRLPLRDLSNLSPLSSLDTATGFNQVKAVLERIEYGVYS